MGEWIMDKKQLKLEVINFYTTLYGEHPGLMRCFTSNAFPRLIDRDFNLLNNTGFDEEIKAALFDMAPLEALGSDGYHTFFYQSQWDHVGASIRRWVKGIFAGNSIDLELNKSLIEMSNLGSYIGVPFFHEKVTNNTLRFVVDKTMMVPKGLCDEIDHIVRKFVWGFNNGNANVALVSWNSVCQPRAHGGLGLRHLKDHNTSFMMNVGFNIVSNVNALWVWVLQTNMIAGDGLWNLDISKLWILEEVINKIVRVSPPHPSSSSDKIVSSATSTGSFFLKNAYGKIRGDALNPKERIWELPWILKGSQWICFFLWLAFKHHLLTNVERVRRGIVNNNVFGFCGQDYEDVLHVLRDCSAARIIWDKLILEERLSRFYNGSLHNWMTNNLQNHLSITLDGVDWPCLFGIITWHI
ncbi:hypothetical protein Golax_016504 [Gossypium laxum]|uniref:Reverse transcriptase zinc-binding domain-containing protein n=1 Tax=Gossypium laxum TaxID=34288 RepID=A0A7J8YYN4_9ROSI|nr:hypothetical protein [Gossypium laxum]